MKFSIILCTYNSSKTLPKALDSILAQSYQNYELIIVDGNSSDGTGEIIKSYEAKFKEKLFWISEKDNGVYEAMNKGIDLAKGDWIYFFGSDDVLFSKQVLEKISKEIKKSDLDVVYGNVKWGEADKIYAGEFSPLKLMQKNICHQAMFFEKNIFKKLGKFETKYKTLADYVFNMRWFNNKDVKRKYVDLIIAKFNTSGISSTLLDQGYIRDRSKIIEKYFPKEYSQLNKKLDQFTKNMEKMIRRIKESEIRAEGMNKIVEKKDQEIKKLNHLVQNQDQVIRKKDQKILWMQDSGFWKARRKYLKMKKILGR